MVTGWIPESGPASFQPVVVPSFQNTSQESHHVENRASPEGQSIDQLVGTITPMGSLVTGLFLKTLFVPTCSIESPCHVGRCDLRQPDHSTLAPDEQYYRQVGH